MFAHAALCFLSRCCGNGCNNCVLNDADDPRSLGALIAPPSPSTTNLTACISSDLLYSVLIAFQDETRRLALKWNTPEQLPEMAESVDDSSFARSLQDAVLGA